MGISGLLPLLKSIQKPCHLKKFAGQTIGVDAYGWLHRGTVACAIDLALGAPTTKFVDFSMGRVNMLMYFGITPYLVFDGDYLPSKAATEVGREKKREESRRLGLELHRMGKISQAQQELQKAVDVTPEMARQLIEELKANGVQYIVAPYEADAQLVYLEKKGVIEGILSEDSDLLVFGAKRLLTKLEQHGDCVEISRDDFTSCREVSLVGWTDADFRRMAILSGCDYLASISKMGLKTAYRLVRKHKTIDRILRMLQFDGQYHVPTGYLEAFQRAELTFLHQRVFCPVANDIVMMTQPSSDSCGEKLDFLGAHVEKDIALGVSTGDLHPMNKKPIVVKSKIPQPPRTPWANNTRKQTGRTIPDLKANKTIDTFYKAYRAPLAELDLNSFTPSPSQQRLLHRANGPWTSSPAPQRANLVRSSISLPSSDPRPSTTSRSMSTYAGSFSVPRPPKRRRLCPDPADLDETAQDENVVTERSKFFAPPKTCPNSSVKEKGKKRRGKAADFNIWSDDSIEEAMAELPDVSQIQESHKDRAGAVSIDSEGSVEKRPPHLVSEQDKSADSQSSIASQSTSKLDTTTSTSSTSVAGSVESQSQAKCLDMHVQSELSALRKQYLYQPEPERCRIQRQEISNRRTQPKEIPSLERKGSMTPLQRLGSSALNKSNSHHSSLNRTTESRIHNKPEAKAKGKLPTLADVLGSSSSNQPAATAVKVTVIKGSEDMIVPDSEAESEGSQGEDGRRRPSFDMGRFAFNG